MPSKTHKIDKKRDPTNLTIAVLALNEASMHTSCLQSASFAEQILVIVSGSSDDTMLIARSLSWSGFSGQVLSLTLRRGTAPEKGVPTLEQTPHP